MHFGDDHNEAQPFEGPAASVLKEDRDGRAKARPDCSAACLVICSALPHLHRRSLGIEARPTKAFNRFAAGR